MHYYFVRVSVPNADLRQMKQFGEVFHCTADSIMSTIIAHYGRDVDVISISKLD